MNAQDMPDMPGMTAGQKDVGGMTMMAGQLGGYSMTRDASGTAWQPDSTPMQGFDWKSGGWAGMVHGYADLIYDQQNGPRGAAKAFSESMIMVMAQHAAGAGALTLRAMLSLDPAMGADGYPLLLQTGETANGVAPLIDRQHPHDLFMELAGVYTVPVGSGSSAFLYVGYPGEPALGPPTFMHRFSGMDDPAAPITHHWLDSTHITFGVVTAGFVHGPFKIEGSSFNGREPDQHRWDFDPPRLDSYSGRISWNPTADWALQASYGYIHSPEQLTPDVSQHRLTASATYNRKLVGGNWQTTFAWGRNDNNPGNALDGFLVETAVNVGRHTIFARAENVQKDELFLPPSPVAGHVFRVSEATLGYLYDIPVAKHLALGLGVQGTLNLVPSAIKLAYGDDPTGYMPFARLEIR
ncbi:MAG TPA: hypothetical protein VG166_15110 [Caulobacteraceae bacterium]|nr:hypothetical protein [Caulobacteraceae bacterium]